MFIKNFRPFKPWLILGVFLAGWWLVPHLFKTITRISLFELQAPAWTVTSQLDDLQRFWSLRNHSKQELIEVGRDLARLNAAYELKLSENESLRKELARLEGLFELPGLPEYEYSVARISRRNLSNWSHHVIIRKGSKHGIPKGAAVVNRKGVIGRIKEVHTNSSVVELVSSPTFRIAAHFEDDNRPITYKGQENPALTTPFGEVTNIPNDVSINPQKPIRLVSSQLGGVFPDGLTVGWLTQLEPGSDGLFKQGKIELDKGLHEIREVAILIPLQANNDDEA